MNQYRLEFSLVAGSAAALLFVFTHIAYGLGAWGWIFSFVLFLLWLGFLTIGFVLLPRSRAGFGTMGLIGALSLVFIAFRPGLIIEMFIGSIFFVLFVLWAYLSVQQEKEVLKKVQIVRMAKRAMPKMVNGFIVLLAIFYGFTAADALRQEDVEIVPIEAVEAALTPAEEAADEFFPEYEEGMSIRELQRAVGFSIVDDPNALEKTLPEFLHTAANDSIRANIAPYRGVVSAVFVAGIFLAFKALSLPLIWLAYGVVWFIQKILLRTGVLRIEREQTYGERLLSNFRR